jgi:ankyrin repeat protein
MWAAYDGHLEVVELLIAEGAEYATENRGEATALHYAARSGSAEVTVLLLDRGLDINARNHQGETALSWAAVRSRGDVVELLVRRGADTELRDDYGRTPLLLVARETGNVDVAALLLDGGADVNALDRYQDTPLSLATWRGFGDVVDLLLEEGAEVPEAGPDANALVMLSAENGLARLFAILAEGGADLGMRNDKDGTLLHSAAEGGSKEIVEALIDRGMPINERDRYGRTPLHYAGEKGRVEVAELLIARGADIDSRSLSGISPLNEARANGRDEVAQFLVTAGADPSPPAFPTLRGPFLGQAEPGSEATLFAADIVASHRSEHCVAAFSPIGDEAFWSSSFREGDSGYYTGRILTSRLEDGRWTLPRPASFGNSGHGEGEPFFSHDGRNLFFLSMRPDDSGTRDERIWVTAKTDAGWSEPEPIEGGPNSIGLHWLFSVAANGSIYFASGAPGGHGGGDVYVSRLIDGRYSAPENLGDVVNTEYGEGSPFVAADESYLIFHRHGQPDGVGGPDMYISFKDSEGDWITPVNMGEPVNSRSSEVCATVTRDGKYIFVASSRNGNNDNYWIDATIIESLRPASTR